MKLCTFIFSGLLMAATANAVEIDASTCNACTTAQKQQRATAAFQQDHQSTQYVLDLVSGDVNKYLVYFDSTCKPIQVSEKGKTPSVSQPVVNANGGGCGSYIATDDEVVEPQFAHKGQSLSVLFLRYGDLAAKTTIDVSEIAASDPLLANMDAFDYMRYSSLRNDLHELIGGRLNEIFGETVADALRDLHDTADRLLADGKAGQYRVKLKFADGSEVNLLVKDSSTSEVEGKPQDANNNDIMSNDSEASGETFLFRHDPNDLVDWVTYMRSLGVEITNTSSGGAHSYSCSTAHHSDGTIIVQCHLN